MVSGGDGVQSDQIWVTSQVVEKVAEYQTPVYLCFIDLSKAYDSVDRTALVAVLRSYRVPHQLVELIKELYTGTCCENSRRHIRRLPGEDRGEAGLRVVSTVVQLCDGQDSQRSK